MIQSDNSSVKTALEEEPKVRAFLKRIVEAPKNYIIQAFERRAISYKLQKTKFFKHKYYAITDFENQFHTLSFYGTASAFYSQGAWAMDTVADYASHVSYVSGENKWEVVEICSDGIDFTETVSNIIAKIDGPTRYYYKDHLNNKIGFDNCITGLEETLVEKSNQIQYAH